MPEIHTIPVPHGMTALDAWDEIDAMGHLVEYRWWKPRFWFMGWAVIEVDEDA